jgi:hypothetical protein
MIEGNFKDASLPGLLQFLATESNKLYRVKISASGNSGEIFVDRGHIISAKYNLLDGEDAMCEFLSWRDGSFSVERLPSEFESTVKKNINLRLQGPTTFVSQSAFLVESNVGLNTVIVPSKKFGGLEWQDALRTQPLEREDFLVIAWIKEGRSMREACREFSFDIVKATSIVYRLLLTHSVEAKRATGDAGADQEELDGPSYQLRLSGSGASAEIELVNPNEPKKAPKAMPVDLASLRASMEARIAKAKPAPKENEPVKPEKSAPPVKPQTPGGTGGGIAASSGQYNALTSTRSNSGQFEAVASASGQFDGVIASSVASTLSALGAAIEPTKPATEEQRPVGVETSEFLMPIRADASVIDCAPDAVPGQAFVEQSTASETEEPEFTGRRTDALPLVTIDIERLLQATFTPTQFGKLALTNQALDPHLRQTLVDVESGKSLIKVIQEAGRSPASILSTYRFCLARGYIISSDPVIPLTADLLLGRMELDQYLLQRRRINGDELRDLIEIERQKGIKLADLLVRHGYITTGDLERLLSEQKRFALK